jgi:hypothetical protein
MCGRVSWMVELDVLWGVSDMFLVNVTYSRTDKLNILCKCLY